MAAAHFTLNTGARVPSVGLGTYKAAPGVVTDVVGAAVKVFALPARPLTVLSLFTDLHVLLAIGAMVMAGRVPAHRLRADVQEREGG
jgi:hypothetical protein